jgi:oxygen-independent coproporphyrinogen-3 oxidase
MSIPEIAPESGEGPPGLYVHIPFCRSKCGYCAFTSYPCGAPPAGYLASVSQEAERMAVSGWVQARNFATLFIGGGTPTIYEGGQLAGLIRDLGARFALAADAEITVEANPNTVTMEKLTQLREAGVNRLSLGVQSFSDRLLTAIGRSHSRAEALAAIDAARAAGFDNLNLDLIYGLPGQSLDDLRASLEVALENSPEHLALYELMVEPNTPMAHLVEEGDVTLPDDDAMAAMEAMAQGLLAGAGLQRYEIANFARPGFECRHNCNYWRNGSYLGLGAAAVSCLSGFRLKNVADPAQYGALLAQGEPPYAEAEALGLHPRFRETVIMGLRLLEGVSLSALSSRFGLTLAEVYGTTVERLVERGLLVVAGDFMRLSDQALPVAHQVLAELV